MAGGGGQWQDLGTQSRIVLICTVLICVTLAGFGTANIAVGAMTEYELTYNTTNFSASVLAAQFNYSAYGTDWCKNTTIIPELNTTLLEAYNKGGADTVAKKALAYGAVLLVSTGFLGLFGFDGVRPRRCCVSTTRCECSTVEHRLFLSVSDGSEGRWVAGGTREPLRADHVFDHCVCVSAARLLAIFLLSDRGTYAIARACVLVADGPWCWVNDG